MRKVLLLVIFAALLAPADALAGIVKVTKGCVSGAGHTSCFPGHVVFRAAPGEANQVTVRDTDDGSTEVRDVNPLDVRGRCKRYERGRVIADGKAVFSLVKPDEGRVVLRGEDGTLFGRAPFDGKVVSVPLAEAGRQALATGAKVRVTYIGFASSYGYTVFLRA